MSDILLELADQIDSQATISSRHGQMYELEAVATQLRAERARSHSWAGLMALLDEHYPADVFTGESDDPGPRIVALIRENDKLRAELAARKRSCSCSYWPDHDQVMPSPNCPEHGVEALDKKTLGERAIAELAKTQRVSHE